MSETRLLPAGSDLLDAVLRELRSDGNNFETNIVVFPGNRPGHFLHQRLARSLGAAFIPPKVYALGEFVEVLYRSFYIVCVIAIGATERDDSQQVLIHAPFKRRMCLGLNGQSLLAQSLCFPQCVAAIRANHLYK